MGENRRFTVLEENVDKYIKGEEVSVKLFQSFLDIEENEEEALNLLKKAYAQIKPVAVLQSIGFYKNQNRSEELNNWLDFTRRFVESIKKDPDKLLANAKYWLNRNGKLENRIDELIKSNIIYQVNQELF